MSPRESYPDGLTRQLQGSEMVRQALAAAREFGDAEGFARDQSARLCIVIEELLTNLRDHGGLTDEAMVQLDLAREPAGIRVRLADPGRPFDPRTAQPNREPAARGGGVGIEIVRAWAKFIDYQVTPEGNRLELIVAL
jgi:anti-sigma regulatory factor (Ser/Thr protein kinase)